MGKCKKTGKVQHYNRKAALKAAASVIKTKGDRLEAYKCQHCFKWHLGNTIAGRVMNLNRKIDEALASDAAKRQAAKKTLDQPEQLSYSDS